MVSLEGVKFIQGVIIARDKDLASKGVHCEVQSSNLNEELGNIKYVFSDKTGTLTRNKMIFKKLLIENIPYGDYIESDSEDEEEDDQSVLFKGRSNKPKIKRKRSN
jgi:phospholipid-transporting ATPase